MTAIVVVGTAFLSASVSPAVANPYGAPGALADAQSGGGGFGQSLSISADGTVGVVGEPNYNGGAGAALVYANANGVWTPVERLEPSAEIGAGHFGAAVSMDGGGRTLIVGAPDDNGGIGSAWVFTLSGGGSWTEQAELVDTGEIAVQVAGRFGTSVAIASSGRLALVGEPLASAGAGKPVTGQAVTYEYFSGWEQWQHMHVAGVPAGAHFGASVAMPVNGGAALVGAPNAAGGDGIVYPYSFYGLGGPFWIDGTPIPSPATKGSFGASVSLSLGGDHAFVGAPLANGGDGEAYEYKPSGVLDAVFTDPTGSTGGNFGASVAVAGKTVDQLLVGAPGDNGGAGAAYDFDGAHGADWTMDGAAVNPLTGPAAGDAYGTSVAVAGDGSNALVGSPGASAADGVVTHLISADITAPDPPMAVQATAGAESAVVTWSPSGVTGGSPVTGFTVTSTPDGKSCTATAFEVSCSVLGLTDGQAYTFVVTATNHAGTSQPSSPSEPITPQAPPDSGGGGGGGSGGGGSSGGGGLPVDGGGGGPSGGGSSGSVPTPGNTGAGVRPGGTPGKLSAPPSKPFGVVKVTRLTKTAIAFGWGRSTDDVRVVGYHVYEYMSGKWKLLGSTAASKRSFIRRGLRHKTRHRFEIRAYDAAGKLSVPLIGGWIKTR